MSNNWTANVLCNRTMLLRLAARDQKVIYMKVSKLRKNLRHQVIYLLKHNNYSEINSTKNLPSHQNCIEH